MAFTESVRSFQVPATPGTIGLAAELAFGADLARHARHFRGERAQLIHHRVDGFLELQNFAAHVDGDLLGQVAVGDRDRHFGDVADLRRSGSTAMELTSPVRSFHVPVTPRHLGLAAELAVGAHLARHARHFGGEHAKLLDHGVDDLGRAQELAFQGPAVDVQSARSASDRLAPRRRWHASPPWLAASRSSTSVLTETSISPHAPRRC